MSAYLRARASSVKARTYPLDKLAPSSTVATGRTIKPIAGWSGLWPPLREFLQNTIDHLDLRKEGGLHPALTRTIQRDADGALRIAFVCGSEPVCVLVAAADKLLIAQAHTFPLHARALDTGVDDTTKGGEATAGGFGDGFKTAIVALLALPGNACRRVAWDMAGSGQHVRWSFSGASRAAVGTFAKSTVLEVALSCARAGHELQAAFAPVQAGACGFSKLDNVMVQTYEVRGIGTAFLHEAVPRLVVFWRLDRTRVLSTRRGDLLSHASSQPTCLDGAAASAADAIKRPEPGVYIRGIWVKKPPLEGAIMAFLGRLNVSGRDRNDVDADELADATLHTLHHCEQRETLKTLLEPLRKPSQHPPTWLTKSMRFLNRLLEADPAFFVHDVFGVPRGALFVSSRTTSSKEPFIQWAATFLAAHGAPLLPLEPKANKHLFSEVSEAELEEACVKQLLANAHHDTDDAIIAQLRDAFKKLLKFVGGSVKVHFSKAVAVAFVSGGHCFVPCQPLTRALAIRVLGVVQRKLGAYDENYTHLQQGLYEALPGAADRPLSASDIDAAIARAKQCKEEAKSFLGGRTAAADQPPANNGKRKEKQPPEQPPHRADDDDEVQLVDEPSGRQRGGGSSSGATPSGGPGNGQSARKELSAQIAKAMRHRADHAGQVLPAEAFAADGADPGEAECLRPRSALRRVTASAACGGGEVFCDAKSSAGLENGTLPAGKLSALVRVRKALVVARAVVSRALPDLRSIVDECVHDGFDDSASGHGYLGFCTERTIVINVAPMLHRAGAADLTHELVLTVCHELAHLLERGGGHGPSWRATQDRLVQCVLHAANASWTTAGVPSGCRCAQCA